MGIDPTFIENFDDNSIIDSYSYWLENNTGRVFMVRERNIPHWKHWFSRKNTSLTKAEAIRIKRDYLKQNSQKLKIKKEMLERFDASTRLPTNDGKTKYKTAEDYMYYWINHVSSYISVRTSFRYSNKVKLVIKDGVPKWYKDNRRLWDNPLKYYGNEVWEKMPDLYKVIRQNMENDYINKRDKFNKLKKEIYDYKI